MNNIEINTTLVIAAKICALLELENAPTEEKIAATVITKEVLICGSRATITTNLEEPSGVANQSLHTNRNIAPSVDLVPE